MTTKTYKKMTSKEKIKANIAKVNSFMVEALKSQQPPWIQPWKPIKANGYNPNLPNNPFTGNTYSINNAMTLAFAARLNGYSSTMWGTFKNITVDGGGKFKNYEATKSSVPIWFWSKKQALPEEVEEKDSKGNIILDATGKPKLIWEARSYWDMGIHNVYNLDVTENVKLPNKAQLDIDLIEAEASDILNSTELAAQTIAGYLGHEDSPKLKHGGNSAFYKASEDSVTLPKPSSFNSKANYYATAFHEFTHSTGHSSRLARPMIGMAPFGSPSYAFEELVAELGSAYLCMINGIDNTDILTNSASYCQNWAQAIEANPDWYTKASSQAVKAINHIMKAGESTETPATPKPKRVTAKREAVAA